MNSISPTTTTKFTQPHPPSIPSPSLNPSPSRRNVLQILPTTADGFWSDDYDDYGDNNYANVRANDDDSSFINRDGFASDDNFNFANDSDGDDGGFDFYDRERSNKSKRALIDTEDLLYSTAEKHDLKSSSNNTVKDKEKAKDDDGEDDEIEDDPRAAMNRFYADQEKATQPPFEEWIDGFFFMRVSGMKAVLQPQSIEGQETIANESENELDVGGEEETYAIHSDISSSKDDEETCPKHGGHRLAVKNSLIDALVLVLANEVTAAKEKESEHDARVSNVRRYVAGSS